MLSQTAESVASKNKPSQKNTLNIHGSGNKMLTKSKIIKKPSKQPPFKKKRTPEAQLKSI